MVYQNVCQIFYFCLLHDKIIFRLNIFNLKSQTKIVGTLLPYAYFFASGLFPHPPNVVYSS